MNFSIAIMFLMGGLLQVDSKQCSDTAAPTIKIDGNECQDYTVKASTSLGSPVAVKWKPAIQDDCDSKAKFVRSSKSSGDMFDVGTTPVMWTYKYLKNTNEVEFATCTFNVIVSDVIVSDCSDTAVPTIKIDGNECQDYTVKTSTSLGSPVAVKWKPAIQDDCDSKAKFVKSSKSSGDTFDVGTTPVMWTYKYLENTNEVEFATCTFNVIVSDVSDTYFNGGDNIAKCDDGTEVSEDECFIAASEVNGNPLSEFIVFEPDSEGLPCGCWFYEESAFFRNPTSVGNCDFNAEFRENLVCKTPPADPLNCSESTAPTIKIDGNECQDYTVKASTSLGLPVAVKWKPAIQDDCDSKAKFVSFSKKSGDTFDVGTTPVMWTYKYLENTNEVEFATCTFNVIVSDVSDTYFNGGDNIAKCDDGTEVSEDECFIAASEVNGNPLSEFIVVEPNFKGLLPCGCWFYEDSAYFRNPTSVENCDFIAEFRENLVCKTPPAEQPSSAPSSVPSTLPPSSNPSDVPSFAPSSAPSAGPSSIPSLTPSGAPSSSPSLDPSGAPSSAPSSIPSDVPSFVPSSAPSAGPSSIPSLTPSGAPSFSPSLDPSGAPFSAPSSIPSDVPSFVPSSAPSAGPSSIPSLTPSSAPSFSPSLDPSGAPSSAPSSIPSDVPSFVPSSAPSADPSSIPSLTPSGAPSFSPSLDPSSAPSPAPSSNPSDVPSFVPSSAPSAGPSSIPSLTPSGAPSFSPSLDPSGAPSSAPSSSSSALPSLLPSSIPGQKPSQAPSDESSSSPSLDPSSKPSTVPSFEPSSLPNGSPSAGPSSGPSFKPSQSPSVVPSSGPSQDPSSKPSAVPSFTPSSLPSGNPSAGLSSGRSLKPSQSPSDVPSSALNLDPSSKPSAVPSLVPSSALSFDPSVGPSAITSEVPSAALSFIPSISPSFPPSSAPSLDPSTMPSSVPTMTPSSTFAAIALISQDISLKDAQSGYEETAAKTAGTKQRRRALQSTNDLEEVETLVETTATATSCDKITEETGVGTVGKQCFTFVTTITAKVSTGVNVQKAVGDIEGAISSGKFASDLETDQGIEAIVILPPSEEPSSFPSSSPSTSIEPSLTPSIEPSAVPSLSNAPSTSAVPSTVPSATAEPSFSFAPSSLPSLLPSAVPSFIPSFVPSDAPSSVPSLDPSGAPSFVQSSKPSSLPSPAPTIDCSNDLNFRFKGESSRTCDSYVAFKPGKRCKKEQPGTGKKVRKFCPGTCKKKCKTPSFVPSLKPSSLSSPAPTNDCSNDLDFRFEGDSSRTCDSYVAFKPVKRCKKEQPGTGKKVRKSCPGTCKKKCKTPRGECENLKTFQFQGNRKFTCDLYVAVKPNKRCRKEVQGKRDNVTGKLKRVRFFCPATCKRKCKSL